MKFTPIPINAALRLYRYDQLTGKVYWKERTNRRIRIGDEAGGLALGRLTLRINGAGYALPRVVWAMHHGVQPAGVIDHKNGNPLDNRLTNLRDVTHGVNSQNTHRAHDDNCSGYLGVSYHKRSGKYDAWICHGGRNKYLGRRANPADAHQLYLDAKSRLHSEADINH
jgi:hypothetical protein